MPEEVVLVSSVRTDVGEFGRAFRENGRRGEAREEERKRVL